MTDANLILLAATYSDAAAAQSDYKALKAAGGADFVVDNAVILSRDVQGKVTVHEGGVTATSGGAVLGGAASLVVGLFAPRLPAGHGRWCRDRRGCRGADQEASGEEAGDRFEEVMPPGTSALVVVVDDMYADRVDKALDKATKRVSKAIDSGDYEKLSKALSEGDEGVERALNS